MNLCAECNILPAEDGELCAYCKQREESHNSARIQYNLLRDERTRQTEKYEHGIALVVAGVAFMVPGVISGYLPTVPIGVAILLVGYITAKKASRRMDEIREKISMLNQMVFWLDTLSRTPANQPPYTQ